MFAINVSSTTNMFTFVRVIGTILTCHIMS